MYSSKLFRSGIYPSNDTQKHLNINSLYLQTTYSRSFENTQSSIPFTKKFYKVCHETFKLNDKRYWAVALKYNDVIQYHIEGYSEHAGIFHDHKLPDAKYEMASLKKIRSFLENTDVHPDSIDSFISVVTATCRWPECNGKVVPVLDPYYFPSFGLEESLIR